MITVDENTLAKACTVMITVYAEVYNVILSAEEMQQIYNVIREENTLEEITKAAANYDRIVHPEDIDIPESDKIENQPNNIQDFI